MKKKKKIHSLYWYLVISFIAILIVVLISTVINFQFKNQELIEGYKNIITEPVHILDELTREMRKAGFYGLIVGIALMIVVATHIIRPLNKIKDATKKVASGDFNVNVDIKRKDEIGDLADNFNMMVKELNSIEYLRKDFISNVSHELKTPIASIQGFTKLLIDENTSIEDKKEYAAIILEETARLSNLSSNMVKLSKFENQEIITNKKKYRLDEQLRKAIIMLEEKMNKKNIAITLKSEAVSIFEDEDLIMEIWINLLNNAVKYTNENGKIEIKVKEESECINVEIKDNGIGIPKEKQERIFEKFYQAERSHSSEGSGLGLPIVKRIVELVDGKITFKSEQGKGTTFIVELKNKNNT